MKRNAYQVVVPVARVVVMAAFLSSVFLTVASPSFAVTGPKKSAAVAKTSAVEHTEARIKQLQAALKISEEQETLWNNLTVVMRDNAKSMDALAKDRSEASKAMTAVEHLKLHSQITEAQLEQQKKFIPPFEALYTSMSDDQKKITDTIFKTGKHGKHNIK